MNKIQYSKIEDALNFKSDTDFSRYVTSALLREQISLGTLYFIEKYSCLRSALQHRVMVSSR